MKWILRGYWDGHQHASVKCGIFRLIWIASKIKPGKKIIIEKKEEPWK